MTTNVVDELMAQRDAVMFGTWMHEQTPEAKELWNLSPGIGETHACLLYRWHGGNDKIVQEALSGTAQVFVYKAFGNLGYPEQPKATQAGHSLTRWNDFVANHDQVITLLDEAIRIAKEEA